MSAISTMHGAHANDGPRFSASDRPLPPTTRKTSTNGALISVAITAVAVLMVFGFIAPTATLAAVLSILVGGAAVLGALHLSHRRLGHETTRHRHDGVSHRHAWSRAR